MDKHNYAIIMAGGGGKRLWPLSRISRPKQFLDLCPGKPMLEQMVSRISKVVKKENIYIATGVLHSGLIKRRIRALGIPLKNYFFEPESKNSFAPIAVISKQINDLDAQGVVVAVPCDNIISNPAGFTKTLKTAIKVAKKGYIATIGTRPTRPETGYGYIKVKSKIKSKKSKGYEVDSFIEKPSLVVANRLIKDKRFYWNAGIFVFRPVIFLQEARKFLPIAFRVISRIKGGAKHYADFKKLWQRLPSISIDYAIMEKTKKIALVPAGFEWVDIGSWEAICRVLKKGKHGNIFKGPIVSLGCSNSLVFSGKRLVGVLGLKDTVVVDTPDALLVCARDKAQDVKKLVEIIKNKRGSARIL